MSGSVDSVEISKIRYAIVHFNRLITSKLEKGGGRAGEMLYNMITQIHI